MDNLTFSNELVEAIALACGLFYDRRDGIGGFCIGPHINVETDIFHPAYVEDGDLCVRFRRICLADPTQDLCVLVNEALTYDMSTDVDTGVTIVPLEDAYAEWRYCLSRGEWRQADLLWSGTNEFLRKRDERDADSQATG